MCLINWIDYLSGDLNSLNNHLYLYTEVNQYENKDSVIQIAIMLMPSGVSSSVILENGTFVRIQIFMLSI